MTSNPRTLFFLLVASASTLLGVLLFALTRWSADSHWLMWCLTTFMHFQLAIWHTTGMLLSLLLGATLLRLMVFIGASLFRLRQRQDALTDIALWPSRLEQATRLARVSSLRLVESRTAELYCFGWFRPTIVISQAMVQTLSLPELTAALRHEEYHRQHRHSLKLFLAEIASQIIWFLPITADVLEYLRYTTETSADRFACQQGNQTHLRQALSKLLHNPAPAWQTAFAGSPAEARVASLLSQTTQAFRPQFSRLIQTLSVLVIFFASIFLLAAPAQADAAQTLLKGAMTEHSNHCPQPRLFSSVDN